MRKLTRLIAVCLCLCLLVAAPASASAEEGHAVAVCDITKMDIAMLQAAVDEGQLTYKQIMTLYLERIEEYADMYECIISVSDTALAEAAACDEIYAKQGRSSDIFGLPVIVKDNIDVAGMATTNGVAGLSGSLAGEDAEIVAAIKQAGGIIVAKANMDTYAAHSQYSISDFGRVNNAFDLSKSSYGSSGGSAVSAAAALAPVCIGTDTNASIRVPASANGVVGLRPTKGLLSMSGITACVSSRDTPGPLARTVRDTAIILSAMCKGEEDYTKYLREDGLEGMRIGVVSGLSSGSAENQRYFQQAVALMEQQGAEIVYMSFALPSNYSVNVDAYRRTFTAAMDSYDVDVVVYLTMRSTVMSHAQAAASSGNSNGYAIGPSAGVPAMSVPMAQDSYGMPVGIEFAARAYDEAAVLTAGYAFEQALDLALETELAPALYEPSAELLELLEMSQEPLYAMINSREQGYDEVEDSYEALVAYAESEYYLDSEAESTASELITDYDSSIAEYEDSCENWERMVNLAGMAAVLVFCAGCAVIALVRRRRG